MRRCLLSLPGLLGTGWALMIFQGVQGHYPPTHSSSVLSPGLMVLTHMRLGKETLELKPCTAEPGATALLCAVGTSRELSVSSCGVA